MNEEQRKKLSKISRYRDWSFAGRITGVRSGQEKDVMRKDEATRCSVAICISHHLFSSSAVDGGDVVGRSLGVERRMMDASEVTVLSFLTSRVWA